MSAQLSTETTHGEPTAAPRDREAILSLIRQAMARGARVVRLGGRMRRAAGDAARRPPVSR